MASKPLAIATHRADALQTTVAWFDQSGNGNHLYGVDMGAGDDRTVWAVRMNMHCAGPHVERIRTRIVDHMEIYWDEILMDYALSMPDQRAMVDEELTKRLNAAADATYVPPTPDEWRERARRDLYEAFKAMMERP